MTARGESFAAHSPAEVVFTERLAGTVARINEGGEGGEQAPAPYRMAIDGLVVRVSLTDRTPHGGLSGQVDGGTVALPALHAAPLPISHGTVELMTRTVDNRGRMHYRLAFGAPSGQPSRYTLDGVKYLATGRSVTPRRIWRETTTLFSRVHLASTGEPILEGPLTVSARDFLRQLCSLRATAATDPEDATIAVAAFIGTFAAKAAGIYLGRSLRF